ncbi:MAG: HAD-IIIA family hydrolase [Nitrospirota bacterium]|jgi:3-deoxy-D-manno-octulosonate 8-phosphate phosphatase (KDO 8-P phosphatase)
MDDRVKAAAGRVRLLIVDVDGVLTDGRIVLDNHGNELKFFHVRDGHGLKLLQRAGIEVAIVTGRESAVVERRAAELGIRLVHQGSKRKVEAYESILRETGLGEEEVAYVGDDIVDVPVMRRAGFSAAVADAEEYVKEAAMYVTERPGGRGAVREITDLILKAGGHWDGVTERYHS